MRTVFDREWSRVVGGLLMVGLGTLSACSKGTASLNAPIADAAYRMTAATSPAAQPSTSCTDQQKAALTTTQHQITLNGKVIPYSATVGFLEVTLDSSFFTNAFNPAGPNGGGSPSQAPAKPSTLPKACLFFTYYQVKNDSGVQRPLTFAFNGGPGSASLWLHLGALGPKRVDMGPDGLSPSLPFRLLDNPDSPLDLTDLVLLDPVATGFSHSIGGPTDPFIGAQNDAESVATFIRDFLDQFDRRDSPLYVMGESYGGIRSSLVAQLVQMPLYIPLKGVILVSPWLSISSTDFTEDDNLLPYYTYFPSFAATAWYHHRIASRYQAMAVGDLYDSARTFALGAYRSALEKGNAISPEELHATAQQMADFTGLSASWIEHLNLRIKDVDYAAGLLYDQNEMVGLYDSRFVGRRLSRETGATANDPSDYGSGFPFVSAINVYLRQDLGFTTPYPYVDSANLPWPYNSDGASFVATHNLSQAFADNSALQVFVASGYYDLVCPMGTVEYERSMLDPASNGRDRMTIHRYESGHMVYLNPVVLHQLKTDLTGFYTATEGQSPVLSSTPRP